MVAEISLDEGPTGGSHFDSGLQRRLLAACDGAVPLDSALGEMDGLRASGSGSLDVLSPEALLLCAEAALKLGRYDDGDAYAQAFLRGRPAANQFLVRAYYCVAQAVAARAHALKADALVSGVREALAWAQRGLELARAKLEYRFLVYNGSVHLYAIGRVLLRPGRRTHMTIPLKEALAALAEADEPDAAWRLELATQLAHAHDEAREVDAAVAVALAAVALAERVSAEAREELFLVQCHLVRHDAAKTKALADGAPNPRLKALGLLAALRCAARAAPPAEGKGGGKGGGGGVAMTSAAAVGALVEVLKLADPQLAQAVATAAAAAAAAAAASGGAASAAAGAELDAEDAPPIGPLVGARAPALHADIVARVGELCASAQLAPRQLRVAAACAERSILSPHLPTRVRAQLVRESVRLAWLDVARPGAAADGAAYTQRMVATRVESLKRLEEALLSAQRVGGAAGAALASEVAVALHEAALPLLQPELLALAQRPLGLAAAALEAIDSPLLELRAQLHAELARAEIARNSLALARAHLEKGLALDVADAEAQARLERAMRPLAERLALRADVWRESDDPDELAYLAMQRARDAPADAKLRKQALGAAAALLEGAAAPAAGDAAATRARALLWHDLLTAAWRDRLGSLARRAAARLLAPAADDDGSDGAAQTQRLVLAAHAEPQVARARVDAHYVLAETHVLAIAKTGRAPFARPRLRAPADAPPAARGSPAEAAAAAEAEAAAARSSLAQLATAAAAAVAAAAAAGSGGAGARDELGAVEAEAAVVAHLTAGLRLARLLRQDWLVLNGCVYLHNHAAVALAALPPSGGPLPLELVDALKAAVRHTRALARAPLAADLPSLQCVLALTTALARAQLALARAGGDARPPAADDEDDYSLSAEQILAARAAAAAGAAAGGKGGGGGGAAAGKGKAAAAAAGKPGAGAAAELAAAADALHWACELAAAFPDASASAVLTLVSVQAALGAKEPWDLGAQHGWYGRHARAGALIEALRLGLRDDAPAALAEIERQLTVPPAAGSAAGSAAAAPAPLPAAGLWALLAERGLRAGQMPCVVRACTTALALLDATGALAGRAQLAPAEWRPFASAEWLHGVALADLAAGSARHSAELRARLRGEAAGHFTTAATYALRAESAAQVCQCAFAFWEQALPLAREPSTRAAAARSARAVLETLKLAQALDAAAGGGAGLAVAPPAAAGAAAVGRPRRAAAAGGGGLDADDADDGGGADGDGALAVARLRQRMYGLVLATLAQAGRCTEGLAVLDEAFALLPPRCHAPLWEQRVSIMVPTGSRRHTNL